MALRVMLVGLVASLGLDLPSSQDLAGMARRSMGWLSTQTAYIQNVVADAIDRAPDEDADLADPEMRLEVASVEGGADAAPIPTIETNPTNITHPTIANRPAIEVVEESDIPAMAAEADPIDGRFDSIVGEMASAFAAQAGDLQPPPALVEVEEAPFSGVAYALNREADGIEDEWISEEAAVTEERPQVVAEEESDDEGDPRGARLGTAVRLTGQAFQAWMSVLQQRTPTGRVGL